MGIGEGRGDDLVFFWTPDYPCFSSGTSVHMGAHANTLDLTLCPGSG